MFFVPGKHHQKMHPIKQKSPAFEFNKKPKHKKSERKDKSEICLMEISQVDPASSNHLSETSREIKQTNSSRRSEALHLILFLVKNPH